MISKARTLTLLLTLMPLAIPLSAQTTVSQSDPDPAKIPTIVQRELTVGERVRLSMDEPGPTEMKGVLMGVEGSDLLITPDGGSEVVRVESSRIWRIQVSAGERRQALKGLGYGAAGGAGLGIVLGLASSDDSDCGFICFSAGEMAAMGGIFLGITGGVVGLIAGALTTETTWNDVPMSTVRPSIMPSGSGGVAFGLSFPTNW